MFAGKEVRIHRQGQAEERFLELKDSLNKEEKSVLRSIYRVVELLQETPQLGDPIRKDSIPEIYTKLNIQNLYRIELANYWRLVYTIKGSEITIFIFILAIMNHKEYNKLFGYKR